MRKTKKWCVLKETIYAVVKHTLIKQIKGNKNAKTLFLLPLAPLSLLFTATLSLSSSSRLKSRALTSSGTSWVGCLEQDTFQHSL